MTKITKWNVKKPTKNQQKYKTSNDPQRVEMTKMRQKWPKQTSRQKAMKKYYITPQCDKMMSNIVNT